MQSFICYTSILRTRQNMSTFLSLPQWDDCKTREDTKHSKTKQGLNVKNPQTMGATTNND